MKTKHTLGPWTYDGIESHFSVFAKDPQEDDKGDIAQIDENQNYPTEEAEANAKLIAAGPEMLEVILLFVDCTSIDGGRVTINTQAHIDAIQIAEKIIQKAT